MAKKNDYNNTSRYTGEPRESPTLGDKIADCIISVGQNIYDKTQAKYEEIYNTDSDSVEIVESLTTEDQKLLESDD